MGGLIIAIIVGVVCGFISKSINESKGYQGGFAWGFLLSIIGIVVVAVRPYHQQSAKTPGYAEQKRAGCSGNTSQQSVLMTQAEKSTPYVDPNYKYYANELRINETDKKFILFHGADQQGFSFSDFNGFDVIENDKCVSTPPQMAAAVDYDEIVDIKIIVHLNGHPDISIPIVSRTYKGSAKYKSAISQMNQYIDGLRFIEEINKPENDNQVVAAIEENNKEDKRQPSSATSQIREFKSLMDDGIITKEEFEEKKRQLLGL